MLEDVRFNLASAVLMMATGSYESISQRIGGQPEMGDELTVLGRQLLESGLVPDLKMLAKLQLIYARAIQAQREREERERQAPA